MKSDIETTSEMLHLILRKLINVFHNVLMFDFIFLHRKPIMKSYLKTKWNTVIIVLIYPPLALSLYICVPNECI